mgnify:CR=1 FL=1
MSTFSDKFDNRWKCIPYSMSTLTTGNGFAILFHLLRRGHTENDITTCSISKKTLADLIGVSSSTVLRAIKNLEQLNLIEVVFNQGNISTFSINWEEIQKIHRVSMQLSDKGWLALREVCSENGVKPLSSISDKVIEMLIEKFPYTRTNMIWDPCQYDTTPYHNDTTPYHIDTTPCHIDTQNKIYIDIENKENHNERSEFNKETDMKILEWFNSRDLSFPDLSSSDFETIINLPDFADNDFDMAIREVWGYLQYDEDSPDNYIPVEYFKDILYRAWNDLKTINPDFSLSEQDMKNIFGFDVEMQNGEPVCYVTPSKIKNINQSPSSSRKIKRKGVEDRTSRLIFLESLRQVAEKDTNMLTDAEYAIWLMIEFVKERESNQQPRPSEVTKAAYEDLLKRFSNESKVPVEDLRTLWKELPQKNTVKLHPQQLSVDKIISYNVQVNQASDVEELYNKKMAEQP